LGGWKQQLAVLCDLFVEQAGRKIGTFTGTQGMIAVFAATVAIR